MSYLKNGKIIGVNKMKNKCDLCHPEKKRCEDCLEMPEEYQKYLDYPVLNPIQTEAYENLDNDCLVVSSPTATGKTLVFEERMMEWKEKKDSNDVAFVLEPLKTLAYQMKKKWDQRYDDLDFIELTGDTKQEIISESEEGGSTTQKLNSELRKHDVIITSYEMFSSLTLKKNNILDSLSLLCVDEIHMLGDKSRGQELEGAIVRYLLEENQNKANILGLSATFDNPEDLDKFFKKHDYTAHIIEEEWSPVSKEIDDPKGFSRRVQKRDRFMAQEVQKLYEEGWEKILVVVFSKKGTGVIASILNNNGISARRHHSGVRKSERRDIEEEFIEDDLEVLVATPTVASGVNLPADAVVLNANYYDGLEGEMKVLPKMQIEQIIGRAGRPQYCDEAKVKITTQNSLLRHVKSEIEGDMTVEGVLYDDILLVLLEELYNRKGATFDTISNWLDMSFSQITASNEKTSHEEIVEDIELLKNKGFVEIGQDGKTLYPTRLGEACAKIMLHPLKYETFRKTMEDLIEREGEYIQENSFETKHMVWFVQQFYDSPHTSYINNVGSQFRNYLTYDWMEDRGRLKWKESPPPYDTYNQIRQDFERLHRVLRETNQDGEPKKLVDAISKLLPYKFYEMKCELEELGVEQVGTKRLLLLWLNGVRLDNPENLPDELKKPKAIGTSSRFQRYAILDDDIDVLRWESDGVNKIYSEKKWSFDKNEIERQLLKDDDNDNQEIWEFDDLFQ